jgi:SAM-dependent methyltransferase
MERPLYSKLVPHYEVVEGRDWESEIQLLTSILAEHECKSLIDLGCGTGYHVRALTKLGYQATGIDISEQNVRFARKKSREGEVKPNFILGSYYRYHDDEEFDAALCLNWSIPVADGELKRFLDNAYNLLRTEGLLIFDFERTAQIVWGDVGTAIMDAWDIERFMIVRVSVGQITSNVLASTDVYILYPKHSEKPIPDEAERYKHQVGRVRTYVDKSFVRFFSLPEIRQLARRSGFRLIASYKLPRNKYQRNYAVLRKLA